MELALVLGILAAIGGLAAPRYLASSERSKACEAFSYLSGVRSAQERHRARTGSYAARLADLDAPAPAPRYFSVGELEPGACGRFGASWRLTLTRTSSAIYGRYTVTCTERGFDRNPRRSTLFQRPTINPLASRD